MWHASTEGDQSSLMWDSVSGWVPKDHDSSLCLNPGGACCDDDAGTCTDGVAAMDCLPPLRHAPGVLCADLDVPCGQGPLGACCVDEDGTCDVVSEAACLALTGTYKGDFTTCDPNPCLGACCIVDGSCRLLSGAQCDSIGGSYGGDETDCEPNSCDQPGESCSEAIAVSMTPFRDVFDNSWASADGPAGSCNADGMIVMQNDRWYSFTAPSDGFVTVQVRMLYHGMLVIREGSDCAQSAELYCASVPNTEDVATHAVSAGVTYWYQIGQYWSASGGGKTYLDLDFVMDLPVGACCFHDGSCQDLNSVDCLDAGGWYQGDDTTCASNPCPPQVPERCSMAMDIPGIPWIATWDNDYALGDGPPPSCDNIIPPPPTMQNDMWFTWTPTEDCLATLTVTDDESRDDYRLFVVMWEGNHCSQLMEIGCEGGATTVTLEWDASTESTYWFQIGHGGNSYADGGGPTTIELTGLTGLGACCFLDGTCQEVSAAECMLTLGGLEWGQGEACDPNPCPQPAVGDLCVAPIEVTLPAELGYVDSHQHTCGRGDNCRTSCLGSYDNQEDIFYELIVTEPVCIDIAAVREDSLPTIGVVLDSECPPGLSCMAEANGGSDGVEAIISGVGLAPGRYTVVVDARTSCITDFTLSITASTACETGACCTSEAAQGCVDTYIEDCSYRGGVFLGVDEACSGMDCNDNGADDNCDLFTGASPDCNGNGIPDECDLASGSSDDYDVNQVPDECDLDCNENGIPDACDVDCSVGDCSLHPLGCGGSVDCQMDGWPDDCQLGGTQLLAYVGDDGTHETSVGWFAGGDVGWMNQFVVTEGHETIGAIELAWGQMPISCGDTAHVYLWSDPNGDGEPTDAQVLASAQTLSQNCDTDVLNVVTIAETYVGPAGTSFFVGAIALHMSGEYPISIDLDDSRGITWAVASAPGTLDPNSLHLAQGGAPFLLDNQYDGDGGNALVRAIPVVPGSDANTNGIPDNCEVSGDLNCDGVVDLSDIQPFVDALVNPLGYDAVYPWCPMDNGDLNEDGTVNGLDIALFVTQLTGL